MPDQTAQLQPPYGIIAQQLRKGNVIPFLGAGASLSGRPANAQWNESATFLPLGSELSRHLAEDAGFPAPDPKEPQALADLQDLAKAAAYYAALADRNDLSKVSSYYTEEAADRVGLVSVIHDMLDRDYTVGAVHRFLADLDAPLLIVTTNYDDLIERAFNEKGKPYHLVAYPTDRKELAASVLWWKPGVTEPIDYPPKSLPLSLSDTTIIYKIHGTVDRQTKAWDSFVITEEDYVDFLARMTGQTAIPARFMLDFRRRRFLFLGYGLRDWNLRVMLKNLKAAVGTSQAVDPDDAKSNADSPAGDLRSWSVQHNPSELEKMLWRTRKVNIYDMDLDLFIAELRKRMGL